MHARKKILIITIIIIIIIIIMPRVAENITAFRQKSIVNWKT